MKDFFSLIFSGVNLPLSILVLLLLLYWLVSMVGGLDNDFEIDADIDGDIDMGDAIESGHSDFEDLANAEVNQDDLIRNKRATGRTKDLADAEALESLQSFSPPRE